VLQPDSVFALGEIICELEKTGKRHLVKLHKFVEQDQFMKKDIKILSTSYQHEKTQKITRNKSFTQSYPHYPH
jgi:hypothetical protein